MDRPGLGRYPGPEERLPCGLDRQTDPAAEHGREFPHRRRNAQVANVEEAP